MGEHKRSGNLNKPAWWRIEGRGYMRLLTACSCEWHDDGTFGPLQVEGVGLLADKDDDEWECITEQAWAIWEGLA